MKKSLKSTVIAIFLFSIASCGSGEGEAKPSASAEAPKIDQKTAYIVYDEAPLMALVEKEETDAEGKTVIKRTADFKRGAVILDKVSIVSEGVTAYSPYSKKDFEFKKVVYKDGNEYWMASANMVEGSLGVVIGSNVIAYSAPDIKKPTSVKFSQSSLVVFNDVPGEPGFVKAEFVVSSDAKAAIKGNVQGLKHYVKRDELSSKIDDTESAILYYLAMNAKTPDIKKTLLETAVKTYPASSLVLVVSDALDELSPKPVESAAKAAKGQATLIEDASVYAEVPTDPAFAANIGVAKKGSIVNVVAKSQDAAMVDGVEGYWVQIDKPKGWVFSGKLVIEE